MATRLKTIEYWFPELASVSDNVDTNFTQITVYIPETVSSFISVSLDVILQDAATTAYDVNRRQVSLQIGASGYTSVNNANVLTQSGEQKWVQMTGDFTSLFTNNWSGTSMTCDARLLIDSAGASPIWSDATAKLTITYNYDDTSTTHIKTVYMPLNAPITSLNGSKPGTANDTFPALDTWLTEDSKTIRQRTIVVQGNEEQAGTTDISLSMQLDAAGGSYTSSLHEQNMNSSSWFRHTWQPAFTTDSTHDFYIWASTTAKFAHLQVWMVITYEFNATNTTTVMNSLLLPMDFSTAAGGTTNADYQTASTDLYIEEPSTITLQRSAILFFWDQKNTISGLNMRVASGAWNAMTSTAATVCGRCGAMLRAETDLSSLSRGKNTLTAAAYRTETTDLCVGLTSLWMINYTSSKSSNGVGAHNHTVYKNILTHSTIAASLSQTISATSFSIPESYYFINNAGMIYQYISNTTGQPGGCSIQAERLSGEGGVAWEPIYSDVTDTDPEVGIHCVTTGSKRLFKRWPGDYEGNNTRLSITTSRRYRVIQSNACACWHNLEFIVTYHSITYTVAGTVSGYTGDGSGITVDIYRSSTNEHVLRSTTSAGGAFSETWYDNTENLYAAAQQDSEHVGRSADGLAA